MNSLYSPPISSDEDDDYEGFYFGVKPKKGKRRTESFWTKQQREAVNQEEKILKNLRTGDLDGLQRELVKKYGAESYIMYDDIFRDGWTLLMHAIWHIQFDIVKYLIDKGVNLNFEDGTLTPLMVACNAQPCPDQINDVVKIIRLLLQNGMRKDISDQTRFTPLMCACSIGHKAVVDSLLGADAGIDAVDNSNNTALHYAVENRHYDIAKTLVNAGADIDIYNDNGQRPRDVAVSLGLTDIENLFPAEVHDKFPRSSEQYETFYDLAPSIFPDHKAAPYSQDIPKMLMGMGVGECAKEFYEAKVSLAEFLTMDDRALQSTGIHFEYKRKRILLGLLKFHGHPFSPRSIDIVAKKSKPKNMYLHFEMYANYLKHIVVMNSSITYLTQMGALKNVQQKHVDDMIESIRIIRRDVQDMEKCVRQIAKTSTKNPLYIGPAAIKKKNYKGVLRPIFKYTVIIGVGILLSCRYVRLI